MEDGEEFEGIAEEERFLDPGKGEGENERSEAKAGRGAIGQDENEGDERSEGDGESVLPAPKGASEADDERFFLGEAIAFFIAEIVGDEDGAGEKAGREASDENGEMERACLEEIGATGSDGAKEDEDQELP